MLTGTEFDASFWIVTSGRILGGASSDTLPTKMNPAPIVSRLLKVFIR